MKHAGVVHKKATNHWEVDLIPSEVQPVPYLEILEGVVGAYLFE